MKTSCTGCSACSLTCPMDALKMVRNSKGFYTPMKDAAKCTNCGACAKVCAMKTDPDQYLSPLGGYGACAAWAREPYVRERATSGGVATEIGTTLAHLGYDVCGAIYDSNRKVARHIVVRPGDAGGLNRMRGTKYLQSENYWAFSGALKSGKAAVFGTPCQIYGFHMVTTMAKIRHRFVLVDFFCHGVPTQLLWSSFMDYLGSRRTIGIAPDVIFRDKEHSWSSNNYVMNILSEDGKSTCLSQDENPFYRLYKYGSCMNESCYACPYRAASAADIRLGDNWGKKYMTEVDGASKVCVNTQIGADVMGKLTQNLEIIMENDIPIHLSPGRPRPPQYMEIMNALVNGQSIVAVADKYGKPVNQKSVLLDKLKRALHLNQIKAPKRRQPPPGNGQAPAGASNTKW